MAFGTKLKLLHKREQLANGIEGCHCLWIQLEENFKSDDPQILLSPECRSLLEINHWIDENISELEKIRVQAKQLLAR